MAIVQVIIPDQDIDIPLQELVGIIHERLVCGPMDGCNRYFWHLEVKASEPRAANSSRRKRKPRSSAPE